MRSIVTYAVVDAHGRLGVFSAQAPIYWRKYIAQQEADRQNGGKPGRGTYRVVRVDLMEPLT